MNDYLEWQEEGVARVRIHRRVLAGLALEDGIEFRGVLLGSSSPGANEVLIEDFALSAPGPEFSPREEWLKGERRHLLPVIGYFRATSEPEAARINESDRDVFERFFPEPHNVLLTFETAGGNAELSKVLFKAPAPPSVAIPPELAGLPDSSRRLPPRIRPPVQEEPEPVSRRHGLRGFLLPAVTIATGFAIGVAGYLAFRGDRGPATRPTASLPARQTGFPPSASPVPSDADRTVTQPKEASPTPPAQPPPPAEIQQDIREILGQWSDALVRDDVEGYL